jgi:hypothetical protein
MDIEAISRWISTNPWATVALGLCTLLSLLFGVWGLIVTIRGTRVRRPY